MADTLLTLESYPADLLEAKKAAVRSLLSPEEPPALFRAMAAASVAPRQNVVGIGVGRKIAKGKLTERYAVRLYVEKKLPKAVIPTELLLPEVINGMETDVIETGQFVKLPVKAKVPRERRRLRPAQPGCSVGFRFPNNPNWIMAGTFGAVVERDGKLFILSNNHVLANENELKPGSPIFQPGLLDGGDPGKDRIASLAQFVRLEPSIPNHVDCAIAEAADPKMVRATFLPKVGRLKSGIVAPPVEGMSVHKVGRTSSYTVGTIFDLSADVTIKYDLGNLVFQDQILIRGIPGSFSAAGDSGSVIVDKKTKRPTALLFAGSSAYTIANPLSEVLTQLGVTVVV